MIQICVLAIAGLFAALIIKKDKPEFAVLIIMLGIDTGRKYCLHIAAAKNYWNHVCV